MSVLEDRDFQRRIQRIEILIQAAEALPDPTARSCAGELAQALLDLHGAGLTRLLAIVSQVPEAGTRIVTSWAADDLVGNLLLLHGLHPVDLTTRVRQALDGLRPRLRAQGRDVELLAVTKQAVRMRLTGTGGVGPWSAASLKLAVEEAILGAAPDVATIEVEGLADSTTDLRSGRIALPLLGTPR